MKNALKKPEGICSNPVLLDDTKGLLPGICPTDSLAHLHKTKELTSVHEIKSIVSKPSGFDEIEAIPLRSKHKGKKACIKGHWNR